MYNYNIKKEKPDIFHTIGKKKVWIWKADRYNVGENLWEYKYSKDDVWNKPQMLYMNLP